MGLPTPAPAITSFIRIKNFHSQKYATGRPKGDLFTPYIEQDPDGGSNLQHWLQFTQADGSLTLLNRGTGLVIDAVNGRIADNTPLQQYPDHGSPNQRWQFRRASDFPGTPVGLQNTWVIILMNTFNSDGPNYVWDVPNLSTDTGVDLQLYHWKAGPNQCWQIENVQPVMNTFKIRCVDGGLAVENYLFQWTVDLARIPQNTPTDVQSVVETNPLGLGLNQVWVLEDGGNGQFEIKSLVNDAVWTIPPDQINQNAFPFLDIDRAAQNQIWTFQDLTGRQGPYKIMLAANTGRVLDMQNGSHQPGIFVQQYAPAHGGPNQQWWVDRFDF